MSAHNPPRFARTTNPAEPLTGRQRTRNGQKAQREKQWNIAARDRPADELSGGKGPLKDREEFLSRATNLTREALREAFSSASGGEFGKLGLGVAFASSFPPRVELRWEAVAMPKRISSKGERQHMSKDNKKRGGAANESAAGGQEQAVLHFSLHAGDQVAVTDVSAANHGLEKGSTVVLFTLEKCTRHESAADAGGGDRSGFLFTEVADGFLLEWRSPELIYLNQVDENQKRKILQDAERLSDRQ